MAEWDAAFTEYFAARREVMRGTAYLLCGDWHRAEDLVQAAFTKLYLAWSRVSRHEVLDAYVRRDRGAEFLEEAPPGWCGGNGSPETLPSAATPVVTPRTAWCCWTRWPGCRPRSELSWCCATGWTSRSTRLLGARCSPGR